MLGSCIQFSFVGKIVHNHFQRFLVHIPAARTETRQEVEERRSIVNRLPPGTFLNGLPAEESLLHAIPAKRNGVRFESLSHSQDDSPQENADEK
jgi:hypothetical protein